MYSPNFPGYPPIYEQLIHAKCVINVPSNNKLVKKAKVKLDSIMEYVYRAHPDTPWAVKDIQDAFEFTVSHLMTRKLEEDGLIKRSTAVQVVGNKHYFVLTEKGKEYASRSDT